MLQSEHSDQETEESSGSARKNWRSRLGRAFEIVLGVAFLASLVFVAVFVVKISQGVSRTIGVSTHAVRLEVVNGTGVPGAGRMLIEQLSSYADGDMDVAVVDTSDFGATTVPRSFVISRIEETEAAEVLAQKLGLDPGAVVVRPREHNTRLVTVTLVLGEDYSHLALLKR